MTFTDKGLVRLKELLAQHYDFTTAWTLDECMDLTRALIARLEAAEDCIDDHRDDCLADIGNACTCGYAHKLEAWRKAKGDECWNRTGQGQLF